MPLVAALALAAVIVGLAGSRGPNRATAADVNSATLAPAPRGRLARMLRDATLVPEMSTPTSRTYRRPDGTFVSRVFAQPPSYRDNNGKERLIDPTLQAVSGGYATTGQGWDATLPKTLAAPIRITHGAGALSMQLEGAQGSGHADGTTMSYTDAQPGVDLDYHASATSLTEDIKIDDPHAPARYAFALRGSDGATATRRDNGTITIAGRDGRTIATLAPSFALAGGRRDEDAVRTDLAAAAGGWRVTLSVDRSWLAAAVRAHGTVTIDPTLELWDDAQDCALSSDDPTTSFCTASLWVGYNGDHDHHSLLKWDTSSIPQDAVALWGNVNLYRGDVADPDADKDLAVHRMRRDWTNDASWARYDATHEWQTPGGDYDPDQAGVTSVGDGYTGYVDFSITRLTQQWITRAVPNYGVAITDAAGPRIAAEKDFYSTEDADAITAPELDVAWAPRTGLLDAYTFDHQAIGNRADLDVNVANGNLALATRDVSVPGVGGLDLEFDHYINSLADGTVIDGLGVRGTGSLGRDLRLVEQQDDSVTFRRGDGVIEPFLDAHSSGGTTTYTTPDDLPGVTLTQDDAACVWTLDAKHGLPSLPRRHLILKFASDGSLTSIADGSGHQLSFIYNSGGYTSPTALSGITDTHGDYYDVDRTATEDETLDNIADPADAHHWTFTYDSSSHLRTQTSVDGSAYSYTYDGSGRLTKVQAPDSSVALLTYDGTSRRVASIVRPSTPTGTTGPTTTYAYSAPTAPCDASVGDIGKVVVTQPDASVTTYCHDARDRVTYNDAPVAPVSGASRLGLEKFWDYDSTDTGSGSSLLVSSDNGNLIWHDVPIVNPGRGLSTFVNLDYNSLERAQGLGVQAGIDPLASVSVHDRLLYNAAGRGISLSVSGPTRLNEPLGGVGLADVRDGLDGTVSGLPDTIGNDITLTDADGTTHHFTRDPDDDRRWIAPPGVHLTLRRFATTGDPVTDPAWVMTRADGVAYFFDRLGYLVKTQDRNGNRLAYTYEKYDLLTGASGSSATACGLSALLGSISGTPSAANGWGLQTLASATVSAVTGKLCTLRLTKVTDPAGRDLTLSYKSRGTTNQSQLDGDLSTALGGGSRTLASLLTSAATADVGLGLLMAPPPLDTITDHAGRQYTFDYTSGDLTSLVEVANAGSLAPAGDRARRWAFAYYAADDAVSSHRLRTITEVRDTDEGGNRATNITYQTRTGTPPAGDTAALVPLAITDRNNNATTYAFSAYGAATHELTVTDARSKVWTRDVDGYGRPVRITDPLGDASVLRWDGGTPRHNDLLEVAQGVKGSDPGAVTTMTYEPVSGRLASQTSYPDGTSNTDTARTTTLRYAISAGASSLRPASDPADGFVADLTEVDQPRVLQGGAHVGTRYTVDTDTGDVTGVQDADGSDPTSATYCNGTDCPKGLVKSETDEVGDVTSYADFDASGLPQTMVDPKGNDIASGFPVPAGHPGAAHAAEHRWLYRYDAVGNLLSVSDPRNPDAQSSPSAATPNARFTTVFTYDAFDRVIQQVTPKDSANNRYITESWAYDRNGNQLSDTNAGTGRSTTATFSKTDQPLTVSQAGWTRTSGDAKGNSYTSRSEVTTFGYDADDMLVSRTEPNGATGASTTSPYTTEYTRDDAGRVVAQTRHAASSQHVTSLALDPRGNVVGQIDAARNAGRTPAQAAAAAASAISSGDLSGLRVSTAYDHADEVTSTTERPAPTDASASPRTDRYTYDDDGNVLKHVLPRDDHDTPSGFTAGAGTVADTYTYDHRDQLLTSTDPTGAVSAVTRRADGQVTSETTPRGTANGARDGDGAYSYFTTKYTYDAGGDLLTRTVPHAPNQYGRDGTASGDWGSWRVSYTRDAVGNPATIVDGRGKTITNSFLDGGQLASTSRPSWWQLSWAGGTTGAPDPGQRFGDPAGSDPLPVGGPQLSERATPQTGADTSADQPATTAQGKFGAVTPARPPDWLPRAGAALFGYDDDGHLTTVADAGLTTSRIDYDPQGRIVGTTQPLTAGAAATRGSSDPAASAVIARRYDYDPDGNLITSSTLGDGSWHSDFTYDSFDRLVDRTDPGASDVPASRWDTYTPAREDTQYTYDANDNLTKRVSPRGTATATTGDYEYTYTYDTLDRLRTEVNPAGDTWGYAYDVDDDIVRELTPNGSAQAAANQDNYKTLRSYDADDRLIQQQGPVVGGVRNTSTYNYFPDGTLSARTDPGAIDSSGGSPVPRLTGYDYDGRGRLYRVTQGHGASGGGFASGSRTTLTEYDANGNLRRIVDPSGVTTSGSGTSQSWAPTNPDAIGDNLTSTTSRDAVNATVYDYVDTDSGSGISAGVNGEPRAVYQPRADTSDSVLAQKADYDTLGRVSSLWNVGNVNASPAFSVHTTYDRLANGWIADSKGYTSNTTQKNLNTYTYDQQGEQLSWTLDPDVTTSVNRVSVINRTYWPNGQMKSRDASDKVTDAGESDAHQYSYWYDPNEALTAVHDTHQRQILFTRRDAAERTASVVQRYGSTVTGDTASSAWQNGRDSAFDYDHDGNVILRRTGGDLNRSDDTMADATSNGVRDYAHFTYDAEDKETIGALYSPTRVAGNPTIDDSTCSAGGSPPAGVRCVRTTYHPSGERLSRRQQDNTLVTTYMDDLGQPRQRVRQYDGQGANGPATTNYSYDARGNRTADLPGEGNYSYNARDELTSWRRGTDYDTSGSTGGANHHDWIADYTRNPDGSIDHTTDKDSGGTLQRTKTYHYTGNRLDDIQTTTPGSSTPKWDVYDYNEFDSVVGLKTGVSSATKPSFTAPSAAKSEDCTNALGAAATDTTLYCYDQFDRLTRQHSGSTSDEQKFSYDGMDRRDTRTDHVGGTEANSSFKYIGDSSVIAAEQITSGTTSNTVSFDRDSTGRPLAVTLQAGSSGTPTTHTFATDANGNPTGLEGSDGSVPASNRYVYDPYGDLDPTANNQLSSSGDAATNPLRFNGFDYDSAVKTYDMQARDYRPDTGRFLQNDRYESSQADLSLEANPLTQDRYEFVGGNPVDRTEFDGHIPGMGSGCRTTYCGDNQGGNMTTARSGRNKGKSTNLVTTNASGTTQPKRIDNPAAQQVTYAASPKGRAEQREAENSALLLARKALATSCLEVCSNGERGDNVQRLKRGLVLGLSEDQMGLHHGSMSTDATNHDLITPDMLAAAALTGGGALVVKGLLRVGADEAGELAARGGASAVRIGQEGESAVSGAYDIGPKVRIAVNGRGRIPDGMTDTTLSEVKNVRTLSYTRQLRDFAQYAQQTGRRFDLYVRPTTRLSGPLQDAAGPNGPINVRLIPGE